MKTAVLICPGRGTYTKTELGSLAKFPDRALLARFDAERARLGQETLTALDGAQAYSVARHSRGDNASALIYACTLGDSLSLAGVEVVAATGNSMGWYSALACAGGRVLPVLTHERIDQLPAAPSCWRWSRISATVPAMILPCPSTLAGCW